MENLDVKQTSCQDGLSQGLFILPQKLFSMTINFGLIFFFFPRDLKVEKSFLPWKRKKGVSR